jgi:hypothetical protein
MDRKNPFSFLRNAWHRAKGSPIEKALLPLVGLYDRISRLWRALRKRVWVLSGTVQGEPLGILFWGGKTDKAYIAELAFGNNCKEHYLGNAWLWSMPFLFKKVKKECALGIFSTEKRFLNFFGKGFFIPGWVGGDVDLLDPKRLRSNSKKNDLNRIKRYGLSWEVTNAPVKYEEFYRCMYLPYMEKAHGEKAFFAKFEELKAIMGHSELLLVKKGAEYIGGEVIFYRDGKARYWEMGVKDGNMDYVKIGVNAALYHFPEEHLRQKGYRRIHYGNSRPFLKDGVLHYKKIRGLVLRDFKKNGFLMAFSRLSPGVRNFLIKNPFIYLEKDKLTGAVFREAHTFQPDSVASVHKEYFIKGMSVLNIFVLGEGQQSLSGMVPDAVAGEVNITRFPPSVENG